MGAINIADVTAFDLYRAKAAQLGNHVYILCSRPVDYLQPFHASERHQSTTDSAMTQAPLLHDRQATF